MVAMPDRLIQEGSVMRVFVTGASGFVGSAVVQELLSCGHQVLGLARSEASAQAIAGAGAQVYRGDVDDSDSVARAVAQVDGVIHTAFNHDFSKFAANCAADRRVIEALGAALAGSRRPLVVTSGTALLASGRLATEDAPVPEASPVPRVASEHAAAAVAARGVQVSVVRLPPTVHGEGDHGFVPMVIGVAREKRVSAYVGEGMNRWPAVHRLDAATLFRLALEKGAAGEHYHAVDDEGVPFRDIAAVIGRHLGVPVVSKSAAEAPGHFGWFAHFAAIDNPASSRRTRELLGWQPRQAQLIADLDGPRYFGQ
jgi:nucleoside-diphosphate-sugar epimerase